MTNPKNLKMIDSVKTAVLTDLLETSDEEVLRELEASGVNMDEVHQLKASVRAHAAALIRDRRLPSRARPLTVPGQFQTSRPPIKTIRSRIQVAMQDRAAVRFRDAKQQTDEDLISLYDDMLELGLINPEDDEG
jgi:hypothetical protein